MSKTKKVTAREDEAPSKEILDQLPQDIKEAILENLDIIRDNRKQQKELLEFTAVRQHKCGCHRKHGTAANNTDPQEVVADGDGETLN